MHFCLAQGHESTIFVGRTQGNSTIIGEMARIPSPAKTLFGRRLRDARLRAGIAQERLGVMIGLDEGSSSARMSRYENGVHEAPFAIAEQIAKALGVSACYFYCSDDRLAEIILNYSQLSKKDREVVADYLISHAKQLSPLRQRQ